MIREQIPALTVRCRAFGGNMPGQSSRMLLPLSKPFSTRTPVTSQDDQGQSTTPVALSARPQHHSPYSPVGSRSAALVQLGYRSLFDTLAILRPYVFSTCRNSNASVAVRKKVLRELLPPGTMHSVLHSAMVPERSICNNSLGTCACFNTFPPRRDSSRHRVCRGVAGGEE